MADNTYDAIVIGFRDQRWLGSKRTHRERIEGVNARTGTRHCAY